MENKEEVRDEDCTREESVRKNKKLFYKMKAERKRAEKAQARLASRSIVPPPELVEARQRKQTAIKAMYELKRDIKAELRTKREKGLTVATKGSGATGVSGTMSKSQKRKMQKKIRRGKLKLALENRMEADVKIRQLNQEYKHMKKKCQDIQKMERIKKVYNAAQEAQSGGSVMCIQQGPARPEAQREDLQFGGSAMLKQQGPGQQEQREDLHFGGFGRSATFMQRGPEQHAGMEVPHIGGSDGSAMSMQQGPGLGQEAQREDLHFGGFGGSAMFMQQGLGQHAGMEVPHIGGFGGSAMFMQRGPGQQARREDLHFGGSAMLMQQGLGQHAGMEVPHIGGFGGFATYIQQGPGQYARREDSGFAVFQQGPVLVNQSYAYVQANVPMPTATPFPTTVTQSWRAWAGGLHCKYM